MLTMALAMGLVLFGLSACSKSTSSSPVPTVRDDSHGMLFSWIDEDGEIHVERAAADVPFRGRDFVRVSDPSNRGGGVFVADLRNARADGTYPVTASSEREFQKTVEARRSSARNRIDTPEDPDPWHGGRASRRTPSLGNADVIIYGASWCGACHEAAAYLRKRGVSFIEKDIEQDARAQQEMSDKLRGAGLPRGSIPVLDVRGKIMVGFSSDAVDEALK